MGHHPGARRIQRRLRGWGRRRVLSCGVGHRHRRLHPHPIGDLRGRRAQTHLWSHLPLRCGLSVLVADHVGPITRTVRDTGLVLNALCGYDQRDPASVDVAAEDFTAGLEQGIKGLRIGLPQNYFTESVTPETVAAVTRAVEVLEAGGAHVVPITIPHANHFKAVEWTLMMAEASAYHRTSMRESYELYTEDVRAFLEVGETILATDYIELSRV